MAISRCSCQLKDSLYLGKMSNVPTDIVTDIQRIKQILNNLLSNAFKFTSIGEVKLSIQRPTEIPVGMLKLAETLSISVTDSGIGIPKDKQQSIFEAFQQADGSTSRRYGGTGLGLSISRQLAQLLGRELTLTSKEGEGSIFTLYLPEQKSSSKSSVINAEAIQTDLEVEPPLLQKNINLLKRC